MRHWTQGLYVGIRGQINMYAHNTMLSPTPALSASKPSFIWMVLPGILLMSLLLIAVVASGMVTAERLRYVWILPAVSSAKDADLKTASGQQAIIMPFPGGDSKTVTAAVETTNKVISNLRKLFCGKGGDARSVAVAIFEDIMYTLEKSSDVFVPCGHPDNFSDEAISKQWSETEKDPVYKSTPEHGQVLIKQTFYDIVTAVKTIWEANCSECLNDDCSVKLPKYERDGESVQKFGITKERGKRILQELYDALCPEYEHKLQPIPLNENTTPQMLISLREMTSSLSRDTELVNTMEEARAQPPNKR